MKHDSMDGFIKNTEDIVIILPPVMKVVPLTTNSTGLEQVIKANVLPLSYEFP
jgi:hypothetical protein